MIFLPASNDRTFAVMVEVLSIPTPSLGDRSYLAHDHHVAVVIDPQRDIDRVQSLAADLGVSITHVAETHIHNDYLTGGLALARATGAEYLVNSEDPVGFGRTGIHDGDRVTVSDALELRALATPGHTFTHLSYVLAAEGEVTGVFTGGSLLYGATGRPDLLGAEHTPALARAQYASAHRLARELPDGAEIFPTHGFGSFCAAGQADTSATTIGQQRLANPALTLDETSYVETMLAGLDTWPAYYAHMGPANLMGPCAADLSPPRGACPAELRRRINAGEWVIDLRDRTAFAAGFLPGSVSFPLDGSFATYLGWTIPWGAPLTLLGSSPGQVAEAQRELARIGFDRLMAAATGTPEDWAVGLPLASLRLASFADLAKARQPTPAGSVTPAGTATPARAATPAGAVPAAGAAAAYPAAPVVLDVRRDLEWQEAHIPGAVHIPLFELRARLHDVPPGEVWVHCHSGYRSMVAASMLAARGRQVVAVADDFDHAAEAGIELVQG
jgi:glyoxylase-like metal-dependent hydrolase (beta-lactamase superfamily II)/rhodanese-related sulfurtransferase